MKHNSRFTWLICGVPALLTVMLSAPAAPEQSAQGGVLYAADFDSGAGDAPIAWRRVSDGSLCKWVERPDGRGGRCLLVEDDSPDSYGAWHSPPIELPADADQAGLIDLTWLECYDVQREAARLSLVFYDDAGEQVGHQHFVVRGRSRGWPNRTLTPRQEQLPLPVGARRMLISIVSGGGADAISTYFVDDLRVSSPVALPPLIVTDDADVTVRVVRAWDMESPSPIREACPIGWERAGALDYLAGWAEDVAASGRRSLRIADDDRGSHGLWVSERSPLREGSTEIHLACALRTEDLAGPWKLVVSYYNQPVENSYSPLIYRVDGLLNARADGLRITWTAFIGEEPQRLGSVRPIAEDFLPTAARDAAGFWRIARRLPAPPAAKAWRVGLLSGWEPENTGTAWLDDVAVGSVHRKSGTAADQSTQVGPALP